LKLLVFLVRHVDISGGWGGDDSAGVKNALKINQGQKGKKGKAIRAVRETVECEVGGRRVSLCVLCVSLYTGEALGVREWGPKGVSVSEQMVGMKSSINS
jgi:hypothetical protein